MAKLWDLILKQNPWWTDPGFRFPEGHWPKREAFGEVKSLLKLELITAINGLRRTGKTTILRQLINELLDSKESLERRICYFSFEEAGVAQRTEVLEELIESFVSEVRGEKISKIQERLYFFLDEVQFVPLWPVILKRYYDLNKNFKFVISGSSSLFLREESRESLAGRLGEVIIFPLSFFEFLRLRGEEKPLGPSYSIRFHQFLASGQFPEIVSWEDFSHKRAYLKEWIIDRVLERDLPRVLKISFPEDLKNLAYVLIEGSGGLVEFTNLARSLGLSRETVRNYSSFLEKALLVTQVLNFSGSLRRRERRQRKIYANSTNFLSVFWGEEHLGPAFSSNLGRIIETYVFQILSLKFGEVYFWRHRGKEVDFIVKKQNEVLPIEVKYKSEIFPADLTSVLLLMRRKRARRGVVLTKDLEEQRQIGGFELSLLPVWKVEQGLF